MSIRQGLTAPEEHKLKTLISKGTTWEEIEERCNTVDDKGREQTPLFADVNLQHVKKAIFDPLVKKFEEAKKAGHKDIHAYETAGGAAKKGNKVDDLLGSKKEK